MKKVQRFAGRLFSTTKRTVTSAKMAAKAFALTTHPRRKRFAAQPNGTICRWIGLPRCWCLILTSIGSQRASRVLFRRKPERLLVFGVPRFAVEYERKLQAGSRWGGSRSARKHQLLP